MKKTYTYTIEGDAMKIDLFDTFRITVRGNLEKVVKWYNESRCFRELREKIVLDPALEVVEQYL